MAVSHKSVISFGLVQSIAPETSEIYFATVVSERPPHFRMMLFQSYCP